MLELAEPPFVSCQGEGQYIGRVVMFVRLAGCPLRCSFCDTKFAWKPGKKWKEEDILDQAVNTNVRHVVLTGGEPMLQDISKLVHMLKDNDFSVSVETCGVCQIRDFSTWFLIDQFTVSPKLSNSGMKGFLDLELVGNFLTHRNTQLKFVVESKEDLDEIYDTLVTLHEDYQKVGNTPIILQPQGLLDSTLDILRMIWKTITEDTRWRKFNVHVLPQLHVLLYGQKRGV